LVIGFQITKKISAALSYNAQAVFPKLTISYLDELNCAKKQ